MAAPAQLLIAGAASRGTITARLRGAAGWQEGTVALAIDNGELALALDRDGPLEVRAFALSPRPIDIPESVFGRPAQLRDVRLALAMRSTLDATWSDDDDAVAIGNVRVDLDWTLAIGDAAIPLAIQHLPALPLALRLSGSGAEIDARIGVGATGTLWSWADLVELADLELVLAASG